MKNKVLLVLLLLLSNGCASLKYPNWDKVKVENSVVNKPCIKVGTKELCSDSKVDCDTWFKKRATIVNANTTVIRSKINSNKYIGSYFQCAPNLPLYGNEPSLFKITDYQLGSNTVRGQAFLKQKGGGVVTCAGELVHLKPNYPKPNTDKYDEELLDYLITPEERSLYKETQCDAQGNFEFHKVPSGKWVIQVNVSWDVFSVESVPLPSGNFYYTADDRQGGTLTKEIIVLEGEENKFIISQ